MGFFDAFRDPPAQTQYGPQYTPVTSDVLLVGLAVGGAIVVFASLVIALGQRSALAGVGSVLKVILSTLGSLAILICIFDPHWKHSSATTSLQYRAHEKREIRAEVDVRIGLHGLNVTLKGSPVNQLNETINYNERFSWAWNQGRLGFGPYAGRINREFRAAQYRGLPLPIQWVVEYFTLDGEQIRWGRAHRQAGYYTHMTLWAAFAQWNLTLILFGLVVPIIGAISLAFTGFFLLISNIIYSSMSSSPEPKLAIPLGSAILDFSYGQSFWVSMVTGIFCILFALLVIIMHYQFPRQLAKFLNRSVQDIDNDTNPGTSRENSLPPEGDPATSGSIEDIENGGDSLQRNRRLTSAGMSFRAPRRKPSTYGEVRTPRYLTQPGYVNITAYQEMLKSKGIILNRKGPLTSTSSLPVEDRVQIKSNSLPRSSVPNVIPLVKKSRSAVTSGGTGLSAVAEEFTETEESEM